LSRTPKPTAIKIAEGNPGKRRLPHGEPKPAPLSPAQARGRCPAWFAPDEREAWMSHATVLARMRVLTEADLQALEMACVDYAAWVRYTTMCRNKALIKEGERWRLNPLIRLAKEAFERYIKVIRDFGMTPAYRTKVVAEQTTPAEHIMSILAADDDDEAVMVQ